MAMKTHRVMPGDTLESIAKAYYCDESLDDFIFQHNATVIANPNQLHTGQVIVIPHLPLLHWLRD
jgi:nucleoid-associated protein YgaU